MRSNREEEAPESDLAAARAFASAYVEYVHYVERLYDAAETLSPQHETPVRHAR